MKTFTTLSINAAEAPRKNLTMPALLGLALAASLPAQAHTEAGQFELSPFVGYQMFENQQNLEDALTYGVRLSYSLTDRWALEGALSMTGSSVDDTSLTNPAKGQFASPVGGVDLLLYQLDALYHFRPQSTFSPYLVFGYGAADYSPSISDKAMSTFNLGVGAKYWLTENLALRADVRDHLVSEVFDDAYHNVSATVGLTFALGGKTKSRSAPVAEVAPSPPPTASTPAPAPAPSAEVAEPEPLALIFDDVHFEFDQATLTNEARTSLQRSVAALKENPNTELRIAGYTSSAGSAQHNQALSERRAVAIKNYLVEQGVSARRLSTIGYGDTRPATREANPSDKNSAAAKQNMRAQLEIVRE